MTEAEVGSAARSVVNLHGGLGTRGAELGLVVDLFTCHVVVPLGSLVLKHVSHFKFYL